MCNLHTVILNLVYNHHCNDLELMMIGLLSELPNDSYDHFLDNYDDDLDDHSRDQILTTQNLSTIPISTQFIIIISKKYSTELTQQTRTNLSISSVDSTTSQSASASAQLPSRLENDSRNIFINSILDTDNTDNIACNDNNITSAYSKHNLQMLSVNSAFSKPTSAQLLSGLNNNSDITDTDTINHINDKNDAAEDDNNKSGD
ncbi:predicted protein [Histoplasma capsulatum var. duboisii H88]|uniref:Predicted protein n=1 Tax=Ajellomyces capsulatus (strain H88) TaxID=544711 RepID=F0UH47_AJEC8|nr:predicted protein [Histoplasma capsulatum var. duboisii H88]